MRERPFLLCPPHEHSNRRTHALIDVDHENLLFVANKNRTATAGGNHSANLHFDNGFTHTASLVSCPRNSMYFVAIKIGGSIKKTRFDLAHSSSMSSIIRSWTSA